MSYDEKNSDLICLEGFRKKANESYVSSMKYMGLAHLSKISGLNDITSFDVLYDKAYKHAEYSARLVRYDVTHEPQRSQYYFSACILAVMTKKVKEAKTLLSEMIYEEDSENKSPEYVLKRNFVDDVRRFFKNQDIAF